MKLHIEHNTVFTYDALVRESIGEARLRPRDEGGQHCMSFRITIDPPTSISQLIDRFGNVLHSYSVLPPHNRHAVLANSLVETSDSPLTYAPPLALLERRDYLEASQYVPLTADLLVFAQANAPSDGSLEEIANALSSAIHDSCDYVPGSTDISTTAEAVLAGRRGVCQDFAHLMIGLCRSLGLPARYVSGYLHDPKRPPDMIVASHAWAEVFLDGRGWLGLDPTHNRSTGSQYVRVAIGRDYADATPVRGVYQGKATEQLEVGVRIREA